MAKEKDSVKSVVKKLDKKDGATKPRKEKKPTDKLADKTALTKFLQGVFGDAQKRVLKRLWKRAQEVGKLESRYQAMSDKELQAQTTEFRRKIDQALKQERAEDGKLIRSRNQLDDTKILNEILPEAFAVAREASKRVLKLRPYDVQ